MIKWSDDYLVGVEVIDQQHKELFRIAGDAYDLLKNEFVTDKYDKIVDLIGELKDYSVFHFKTEEAHMIDIGYKKYLSHKSLHNDFIETVNKIDLEKVDEQQDEYILSIIEFAVDWIVKHIYENDKLIVM
ncbi:bacteriohemerythrin [Alkalibaculum sp. M08DMB]|uniref:Bacteriohemerythrin n=1 Tax=Alkalibaculum sporogenes TaxID=2655001 RepID=A0A6A7KCU7_9FIRM|nr:hemerythrin family protein [Alkalibaculum sporogenes]MPW26823.1 bacteriohemerythrin [Alkalibaculum sporogenes]